MAKTMISTKPYLIRAIREWAIDNGVTPQILVDAEIENVSVPPAYVQDGKIVLNIHDRAVNSIELNNEWVLFSARFGGVEHHIEVPVKAVLAIYARENGQGLFFKSDEAEDQTSSAAEESLKPSPEPDKSKKSPKRPHLKLVQ